jgi:class 3 adenylate cyclase
MRCANCGAELLPGKAFCHACGAPAQRACPNCKAPLEGNFKFCPDCGFQLAETSPPPPRAPEVAEPRANEPVSPFGLSQKLRATKGVIEGERKLVTVLFCDLACSTAIAESLDPEDYRELLEQYVALGFSAIYRFEGIVNQLAGDGMMALFGAPIADEDAPQRAILAALAIQQAMGGLNEKLRDSNGPELRARIGIHTGPVVVGTVGNDMKMDYTAIGDTTNLASRLESLCPPGSILVSEQTYSLVRGLFDMRQAGPFAVKGKSEPVAAYEVQGQRQVMHPMMIAEERGLTPLVGREEELAHLDGCYQRLKGGLPQVVTVVGESGSGRSRLVYEFKQRIAGEPIVFEARCSSLSQRTPYYPWLVMLQQYFDLGMETPSECACEKVTQKLAQLGHKAERGAPYLCRMLSLPSPGLNDTPAEDTKRETYEAIASVFKLESMRAPVVIVIEDLHWIDEASREMLERAVSELGRTRLMLLLTHRPDLQAAWRTTAALTQLTLSRLSDSAAVEIIRSIAGGALPEELEKTILTKAEGSPFFTEEITRALLEGDFLERDNGGHRLTRPVEEITIPGTVQEVIAARLDRLDPEAARVVQVGAVMGRQFSREQFGTCCADGIDVDRALTELERRGIIHRKTLFSDDIYRFGESLTLEVAYEGLLLRQRRELHERIGNLLDAQPGERTAERSALLAHHFAHSANNLRAIEAVARPPSMPERCLPTAVRSDSIARRGTCRRRSGR